MPDNNPVERAIRPLALGRKNWLFAGSDTGGHRAAAIASGTASCSARPAKRMKLSRSRSWYSVPSSDSV
jgi:hypothetical protein